MYLKLLISAFLLNICTVFAQNGADGTWDTTFFIGSGVNGDMKVIHQLANGKIIIAGLFTEYNGFQVNQIARLYPDGTLDTTFEAPEITTGIGDIFVDTDGKIIISGYEIGLIRLNTNGTIDDSFQSPVESSVYLGPKIAKQGDKYIITGVSLQGEVSGNIYAGIARLNNDGSLDETFHSTGFGPGIGNNSGWPDIVKTVVLPNNKLLALGHFGSYNGTNAINIVRLNENGDMDATFNIASGSMWGMVRDAVELSDGGYVITGTFVYLNGTAQQIFTSKLDANGSIDPNFNIELGYDVAGVSIARQADGKILVAGWINTFNNPGYHLVRILENGDADPDFVLTSVFNGPIEEIFLQDDEKILVAGRFTQFGNITRNKVGRLNNGVKLSIPSFNVNDIVIYPNPVKDKFLVKDEIFNNAASIIINIFDMGGSLLYSNEIDKTSLGIDISAFKSGFYFVKLTNGKTSVIKKIIKL
ncbi:MAG: T9SS type A sorting domain-containing protein [Bacteroidota bacterium]